MATFTYSRAEYGSPQAALDPDILYFNATINNNDTTDPTGNEVDPQVAASYQRQRPLLNTSSDYMMSVVRLSTNGATRNLPILIPQVQTSNVGVQWTGSITGTSMTVTPGQNPVIAPGAAVSGSGQAIIMSSSGTIIGSIPYILTIGNDGNPITIASPPAPGTSVYALSSPLPPVFYPGDSVNPAGTYYINSLVNASLFIGTAQPDINLTVYSFTITAGAGPMDGFPQQQFVQWVTQEPTATRPAAPVTVQNISTEYYYCYSYDWWVSLSNIALENAWVNAGSPGTGPPVMTYYQTGTNGIMFVISPSGEDQFGTEYNLHMNSNMANLFPNFPGQWENKDMGRTFKLKTSFGFSPNNTGAIAAATPYASYQEFPGTTGWTPVDSLIITTSQLPITPEQMTAPTPPGGSDTGYNRGVSAPAFQMTLLDVTRQELQGAEDWRSNFVYEATGEYRMISLTAQTGPIQSVDLQAWWRNRLDDNLYPLRLTNGSSLSVKLMFRRKQMGV